MAAHVAGYHGGMPVAQMDLRAHRFAILALAVVFVLAAAISGRSTWDRFEEMLHGAEYVGSTFDLDARTLRVNELDREAEQAGLRKADIVRQVNGKPVRGWWDIEGPIRLARTGDRLSVLIAREGPGGLIEKNISVPLRPFTYVGYAPGSAAYVITILFRIFTPLFCLALGFWVAAVRIGDRAAWALLAMMLSVANVVTDDRTIFGHEGPLQPFLSGLTMFFIHLGYLALFYFAIIFPQPLSLDRRFPWIKWVVIAPMLLRAALLGMSVAATAHHRGLAVSLYATAAAIAPLATDVELTLIALSFVILGYKTLTAPGSDGRRRLLLLDTGAAAGLLPFLAKIIWLGIHHQGQFRGWSAIVSIAALLLFPLTMAYVIVVHRAMDVRVVLRQGLQYLLATGGVRALQVLISIAIILLAANFSASWTLTARVLLIAAGFLSLLALGSFAERLRRWIDRRFFREAYEADKVLADLATRVKTMVETGPLLETVTTCVAQALHVPRVAILLNGNGAFRPAHALGYATPPSATFFEQSLTPRRVRQSARTFVEFGNPESWVQLADREERAALEDLKPELLLPLSLNDKLLGIMSLGPKQSEEPFSPSDLRLLDSVAAQTGLALENGRLTEAIKAEVRAREKQNRELELGREVQERLFPQEYPAIPGLEYVGACRPALGVGGDYYDFIPLPNGALVIAIGDISGKGIPAALLMATLRAFLRGQSIDHHTDLPSVIANLNRLVYESSAPNRYATFFLATYHPDTRVLRYVNAGHNPPMLVRTDQSLERLDTGGLVVGLLPFGAWELGQVSLQRGDLLTAFTDGISEAMNAAEEEWGEERLLQAIQTTPGAPPSTILNNIMQSADCFVAGAPQFDDMTLIIARVG